MTSAEVEEQQAARRAAQSENGAGTVHTGAIQGNATSRIGEEGGFPDALVRIEDANAAAQAASSLADDIFRTPEPRVLATIRGHSVECTTLTVPQLQWIDKHCYAKAIKGQQGGDKPEREALMDKLIPAALVFGLRAPGTDTPVFRMDQAPDIMKISESMGIMTTILDISGYTKAAKKEIAGNSGAAEHAA